MTSKSKGKLVNQSVIRLHEGTLLTHPSRQLDLHPDPVVVVAAQSHEHVDETLESSSAVDVVFDEVVLDFVIEFARNNKTNYFLMVKYRPWGTFEEKVK